MLLNVSREDSGKKIWDKLRDLYQSKSLVKKFYHLRMEDGNSMIEHINSFNTLVFKFSLLIL